MFLNSPLFVWEKCWVSEREGEVEWKTRCALQKPTQIELSCTLPLCLAPGRPDCHLENEGHYLQRVKKTLGDVADVTSKALHRGLGSVKKLMQQDWRNTWDDCRSYHAHSLNRAEDNITQTVAVKYVETVLHVQYMNKALLNMSVFDDWLLFNLVSDPF